jgi:transcriptional regulator with PAS, ATPase and Fis domain
MPLAFYFLQRSSQEFQKSVDDFSAEAVQALLAYFWPGNIRELENVVSRAVILTPGQMILPEHLALAPLHLSTQEAPALLSLESAEKRVIEEALRTHHGNISGAAKQLNVSRTTLYKKIREYGIAG